MLASRRTFRSGHIELFTQLPSKCRLWVTSRLHGHCVDTSALRAEAGVIGGKADVEIEGLLSARERKSPSRGSNFRS